MSLLLMVILATIRLSAIFLAEWFLSFFPPDCNSLRSSATLPCQDVRSRMVFWGWEDMYPRKELCILTSGAHFDGQFCRLLSHGFLHTI